ncbi:MAG: glycosyl hydrolase 53 family protein [Saprospiraceae bacterium]|nr:glycosyl hydrolase 53 family protein [Saprospiraceae bacterium]
MRVFNDPSHPKGYAPSKGYCNLEQTKMMAKRVKKAGMKLLLIFIIVTTGQTRKTIQTLQPGKENPSRTSKRNV